MKVKVAAIVLLLSVLLLVSLYVVSDRLIIQEKQDFLIGQNRSLYTEGVGETVAKWTHFDRSHFSCIFNHSDMGYLCGIDISLANSSLEGLDLTDFDQLIFKVVYTGPGHKIRLSYRNVFFSADRSDYGKQHEITEPLKPGLNDFSIPLQKFVVPDWWKRLAPELKPSQLAPQRNNVIHVGFDIETPMDIGTHEFELIEFYVSGSPKNGFLGAVIVTLTGVLLLAAGYSLYVLVLGLWQKRAFHFWDSGTVSPDNDSGVSLLSALHRVQVSSGKEEGDFADHVLDSETLLLPRKTAELAINEYVQSKDAIGSTIMLMDIEQLPQIRSNEPPDIVNDVLKELNQMIKDGVTGVSITAHWECDKILIVSSEIEESQAADIAEMLEQVAAGLSLTCLNEAIRVSIGVSNLKSGESFSDALNRAEKALLLTQKQGNRRA